MSRPIFHLIFLLGFLLFVANDGVALNHEEDQIMANLRYSIHITTVSS
jgi:hypothetical protein